MKIGMFVTLEWETVEREENHLKNILEQVRAAKEAGFSSVWLPQHFVTGPNMRQFAASPIMGLLAGITEGMTMGTAVLLLPMLNPVLLAEEAATLDHLTGGNFILGVGLGYRDHEFQAMGIEPKSRMPRFVEYIEVMRRLLSEDSVTHYGRFLQFENIGLSLRPKNPNGLPIWIGGTVDAAVKRAAKLGDSWMGAGAMGMDEMQRWWKMFHETRVALGKPLDYARQISRECFCGPDMNTAIALARGPLMGKYSRYAGHGFGGFDAAGGDPAFRDFARNRFVVGDEVFVRDELQRYRDALGATEFRFRVAWPGLAQKEVLASIGRLGRVAAMI
jgi:alkanesulfonate monooxygenase SsuD/methylene tetrahydromethanopterin reductase-like flavin-dependent oxidoreductase (luciferase family)